MRNVRVALRARGKEMEDCAIMPDVNSQRLPFTGDIGFNPGDACRSCTEPRARASQRPGRYVQDGDARQATIENVIHEAGIPAPDIDDSGVRADTGALEQPQRRSRTRLIPAHFVAAFGRVHSAPSASWCRPPILLVAVISKREHIPARGKRVNGDADNTRRGESFH